jgi:starch-binding outer membrane protein, SusD/RagB family
MKKHIILICVFLAGLTSCNDFLEVSSDSKYGEEYVFGSKDEINRVLTSVYTSLMSNDTYGNAYFSTFALNTDVEFTAYSNAIRNVNGEDFRCFDGTQHGSSIRKFWDKQYEGIERANIFINGLQNSSIFDETDADLMQQLGEAKVLRAMFYHDLVVMFGDVPFSTEPAYKLESLVTPITDRNEILNFLISDLTGAAPGMQFASTLTNGVERVSREFCFGMIARMALTRGGYALYPDAGNPFGIGSMKRSDNYIDYYKIAMQYADSVISSGTHMLAKPFRQVFIDQCNNIVSNNDDPIFEIPFLRGSSGNVGYVHGPSVASVNDVTKHNWGASNGGTRLNAFYRFSFDPKDLRRDYTIGMWYYDADEIPQVRVDYSTHNNKWSKLWANSSAALGSSSTDKTGINFPYMRYADVLLMYAEAVNEVENGVNGPNGQKAIAALKAVRSRAFSIDDQAEKVDAYVGSASASKETFFDAIANERKWEFGGENIRWKDLVRWNLLSKVVYESFMEYYIVGSLANGNYLDGSDKYEKLPLTMFYKRTNNPGDINVYPNTSLRTIEFHNLWEVTLHPGAGWEMADFYSWGNQNTGEPSSQCLYSFRGYIIGGSAGNYESINPNNLPPVRYILPIPNYAIQMSQGAYTNYYGYR